MSERSDEVTAARAAELAALRMDYAMHSLDEREVLPDPVAQFHRWFDQAKVAQVREPNAMTLATANAEAIPSARVVLLKGADSRGFVFFTDYRSRKGQELTQNPRAALVFWWGELERQVRISGVIERTSLAESEAYFHSRPVGSQLGAWTSHQSSVIPGRSWIEQRLEQATARFADEVPPLPEYWGGFRVVPIEVEFWQGRQNRLHDRIRYRIDGNHWVIERLSP